MDKGTSHAELVGFVVITGAFVVALHQLGGIEALVIDWGNPVDWADTSATEDIIGATMRSVGLAVGYWLLATTALYVVSGAIGRTRRPRWVTFVTLPGIRKMVDRTLATALAASLAVAPMSPALALTDTAGEPPVVYEASDGIPVPHVVLPPTTISPTADPEPAEEATTTVVQPQPRPVGTTTPSVSVAEPTLTKTTQTYTVRPGDNLWMIATDHLATTLGDAPSEQITTTYWRLLIAANHDTIRSGDPNLIFPGELINLPEVGLKR